MARQDVTEKFDCLKAERDGVNTLILRRLPNLYRALDNRPRRFEIEYRWHEYPTSDLTSVKGNEFVYFGYRDVQGWKTKSLFDLFQLF